MLNIEIKSCLSATDPFFPG